jgi:hypothetical protein
MKLLKFFLILATLFANQCMSADWRYVGEANSQKYGSIVMFVEITEIKSYPGKLRLWIQSVTRQDLDTNSQKLDSAYIEINEKRLSGYEGYAYMANPQALINKADFVGRRDFGSAYDDKHFRDRTRETLIRLAILDEITINKTSLKPTSRAYLEIDVKEGTVQDLQFIDINGNSSVSKSEKVYAPPNSVYETLVKIAEKFMISKIKKDIKNEKSKST